MKLEPDSEIYICKCVYVKIDIYTCFFYIALIGLQINILKVFTWKVERVRDGQYLHILPWLAGTMVRRQASGWEAWQQSNLDCKGEYNSTNLPGYFRSKIQTGLSSLAAYAREGNKGNDIALCTLILL
jgi:hypothetical protein